MQPGQQCLVVGSAPVGWLGRTVKVTSHEQGCLYWVEPVRWPGVRLLLPIRCLLRLNPYPPATVDAYKRLRAQGKLPE